MESVNKFNQFYSDESLVKLKIISSYFTEYPMNLLALYIKVLECKYTLRAVFDHSKTTSGSSQAQPNEGFFRDLCREIMPFCNSREQNTLNNLLSFYENMENMQEMMQMMEFMQEMGGFGNGDSDGNNEGGGGSMDLADILSMMNAFTGS